MLTPFPTTPLVASPRRRPEERLHARLQRSLLLANSKHQGYSRFGSWGSEARPKICSWVADFDLTRHKIQTARTSHRAFMMEVHQDQRRQRYHETLLPATIHDDVLVSSSLEDGSSSSSAAAPAPLLLRPSCRHGLAMAFVVGVVWPLWLWVAFVSSSSSSPAAAIADLFETNARQRQGLLCGHVRNVSRPQGTTSTIIVIMCCCYWR